MSQLAKFFFLCPLITVYICINFPLIVRCTCKLDYDCVDYIGIISSVVQPSLEKSAVPIVSVPLPLTSSASTNWDCPSCCVSNKTANVKCVCCGEANPVSCSTFISLQDYCIIVDKCGIPSIIFLIEC